LKRVYIPREEEKRDVIRRSIRTARDGELFRQLRGIGTVEEMGLPVGRRKGRGVGEEVPPSYQRPVGSVAGAVRDELGEVKAEESIDPLIKLGGNLKCY